MQGKFNVNNGVVKQELNNSSIQLQNNVCVFPTPCPHGSIVPEIFKDENGINRGRICCQSCGVYRRFNFTGNSGYCRTPNCRLYITDSLFYLTHVCGVVYGRKCRKIYPKKKSSADAIEEEEDLDVEMTEAMIDELKGRGRPTDKEIFSSNGTHGSCSTPNMTSMDGKIVVPVKESVLLTKKADFKSTPNLSVKPGVCKSVRNVEKPVPGMAIAENDKSEKASILEAISVEIPQNISVFPLHQYVGKAGGIVFFNISNSEPFRIIYKVRLTDPNHYFMEPVGYIEKMSLKSLEIRCKAGAKKAQFFVYATDAQSCDEPLDVAIQIADFGKSLATFTVTPV